MFKKSKWKIVAVVFSILFIVLFGTFCVIYMASYAQMARENSVLLEQYIDSYILKGEKFEKLDEAEPEKPGGVHPETGPKTPPRSELSTFYSVAVSKDGEILQMDTGKVESLDEDTLINLALDILENEEAEGVMDSLFYRTADKGDYYLAAFLDDTVSQESTMTILNYTLLFGLVALIPLFFLALYLAGKIVSPLEESYKRQKRFISDAGHELKTPVAVTNANVELLARQIGENQWLSNIQYENERMHGLITQLLELAKTENVVPQMENLNLSRLVLGEALPFETIAFDNSISLETDISDDISIYGNDMQLKQLVSILVDNAVRHSTDGGTVLLRLRKEKNNAVIYAINDGPAIPADQQEHLFDRFYRADESRTDSCHYGLGLAIAKAICESHGGTINVESADGKVVFKVKLPLQNKMRRNSQRHAYKNI